MADNQEQLFNEFADLAALEAQQKKILDIFEKVKAGILDLNKSGIKIDSASGQRGLGDALKNQKKQQDELTLSINEYNKLLSQRAILEAKLSASGSEQAKSLNERKLALKEINKEQQLRIRLSKAEEGSIDQLSLKYQKVTGIISKLSKEQRESARGQSLVAFAGKTQEELKKLDAQVGSFRRNVGNYANSLAGGFESVRREIARLERQKSAFEIGGDTRGAEAAARQISELNNIQKISLNTNNSFTKTVRQLEREYQNLATSGNVTNEFLQEFKKFVADAKDQAGDLREEIKALSSDTRAFDLVAGSISTIASGFEAASGAAALFGADTEDVQKSIQRLVAIQSVANGIREIANQITQRGTAANKAYNFVLEQGAVLFGKGSTAAQRFSAALKGVLIFAVIGFIIQAVKALKDFDYNADGASKSLEKLNDELERNKRILESLSGSDAFDFKSQLENLKKQGQERLKLAKSDKEAEQIKKENLKREFDFELQFRKDNIKKLRKQADDANYEEVRVESGQIRFRQELLKRGITEISEERKKIDKEALDLVKKNNEDAKKALSEAQRDLILFNKQFNTELAQQDAEDAQERRKQQESELKKSIENEKKAALELLKLREEINIEIKSAQADDNLGVSLRNRLLAANESAESQKKIIIAEKNFELDQEKLTKSQIKLINEKAANDIRNVELDLAKKIIQIRIEEVQKTKELVDDGTNFYAEISARNIQALEKSQNELAIIRDQDLKSLAENYRKELELAGDNERQREKAATKFNDRKLEIELGYQAEILRIQIEFYKKQLDLSNLSEAEKLVVKSQLAKAEADLADLITNRKIANDDKEKKSSREKYVEFAKDLEKFRDIYTQVMDVIGSAIDAIATSQLNAIQAQLDAVDKLKAAEIDRITKSTDSEEKKAARIKIVEARAQSDREALERRQRQVKRQQAIFDKANNIANIILNTAEAVTKWLAKGNIGLSIAAGVIGAAQLAIAIATPIPQFAKGKKAGEYEGYGIVGEAGREMAIDEKGKVTMYEKPTLTYLSRGTTILPNQLTEDILNANNMALAAAFKYDGRVKQDPLNNHMIQMYEEQISLLREIKNKEMTVYNHVHNDANWNSYIEQHVKR